MKCSEDDRHGDNLHGILCDLDHGRRRRDIGNPGVVCFGPLVVVNITCVVEKLFIPLDHGRRRRDIG